MKRRKMTRENWDNVDWTKKNTQLSQELQICIAIIIQKRRIQILCGNISGYVRISRGLLLLHTYDKINWMLSNKLISKQCAINHITVAMCREVLERKGLIPSRYTLSQQIPIVKEELIQNNIQKSRRTPRTIALATAEYYIDKIDWCLSDYQNGKNLDVTREYIGQIKRTLMLHGYKLVLTKGE